MRLNEVDEFEDIKLTSAEEKLKYAEIKASSLNHHIKILKTKISRYNNFLVLHRASGVTEQEAQQGYVGFQGFRLGDVRTFSIYQGLSPHDKQELEILYKRVELLRQQLKTIDGRIGRLRLDVKKESGTYVSQKDLAEYERRFGNEIANFILTIVQPGGFKTYYSGSKTKKNGTSMLYIGVEPPISHKASIPEKALFINLRKTISEKSKEWLFKAGFKAGFITTKLSSTGDNDYRRVRIVVRVMQNDLINRYKK